MKRLAALIAFSLCATLAHAEEPDLVRASRLPKEIRALHSCAKPRDEVYLSIERFAKAVVFIVTCPSENERDFVMAVYTARDKSGHGARRVHFPALAPDGTPATLDLLQVAAPVREMANGKALNDPPWISGAWQPKDRPGVCMVVAHWRLGGDRAELMLWEEANTCPPGGAPDYKNKVNRNPPPLVGP